MVFTNIHNLNDLKILPFKNQIFAYHLLVDKKIMLVGDNFS